MREIKDLELVDDVYNIDDRIPYTARKQTNMNPRSSILYYNTKRVRIQYLRTNTI